MTGASLVGGGFANGDLLLVERLQDVSKPWASEFVLEGDRVVVDLSGTGEWVLRVFYREQKVLGVVNPALDPVPVAITPRTALFGVMVLLLRSPGWDVR